MRAHLWDDKSMDTPVLYVRQNNFWEVIMSWPTILEIRMTRSRSCSTKKCCWEIILHLSRIWAQFGSGTCMLSILKKIKKKFKNNVCLHSYTFYIPLLLFYLCGSGFGSVFKIPIRLHKAAGNRSKFRSG